MLSVAEYVEMNPDHGIDFEMPLGEQERLYDPVILRGVPIELEPSYEFRRHAGRGRPNLNQTLTHFQCKTCQRVLRNDQFYLSPSIMRRNGVFSHCRACTQVRNAQRYSLHADAIRERRYLVWRYLAPSCMVCGFDKHESAIDMHHLDAKESQISTLITDLAFSPTLLKVEKLLNEAQRCVPLCSNCHRMLHANAIFLPDKSFMLTYTAAELLLLLDIDRGDSDACKK